MKKQLTQLQDDRNIPKENRTPVKGKICFLLNLNSAYFPTFLGLVTTELISSLFIVHLRLYETL